MKIFVASADNAKAHAKKFIDGCKHDNVEFFPWWEYFSPGETLLETLNNASKEMDAAVIILTPDGMLQRGNQQNQILVPNQNILFEFGFFYGAKGKSRVAVVKYGAPNLPSDLGGYVHIPGSSSFTPNMCNNASAGTKAGFKKWIDTLIANVGIASKTATTVNIFVFNLHPYLLIEKY